MRHGKCMCHRPPKTFNGGDWPTPDAKVCVRAMTPKQLDAELAKIHRHLWRYEGLTPEDRVPEPEAVPA